MPHRNLDLSHLFGEPVGTCMAYRLAAQMGVCSKLEPHLVEMQMEAQGQPTRPAHTPVVTLDLESYRVQLPTGFGGSIERWVDRGTLSGFLQSEAA